MHEKIHDSLTTDAVSRDPAETVVGASSGETRFLRVVLPVLGLAAGVGLRWLAAWMASLPWIPWQGLARSVDALADVGGTWTLVGLGIVGAVVGACFAQHLVETMGRIAVTSTGAGFKNKDTLETVGRTEVTDVFVEGASIVLLAGGRELHRWPADLPAREVGSAFTHHGWPWRAEGDPFRSSYRRWEIGDETLPAGADALFRARAGLIEAGKTIHVREVRADLAAIGVVVRDEGKVQHWRLATDGAGVGAVGVERRA
ncbi:YqeB family protein [Oerskovia jenensis]|uniref:YqeB family protein n=1 Tax=Oerskovia jenensis TaxID=162169 RepID=UPI0036DE9F33